MFPLSQPVDYAFWAPTAALPDRNDEKSNVRKHALRAFVCTALEQGVETPFAAKAPR